MTSVSGRRSSSRRLSGPTILLVGTKMGKLQARLLRFTQAASPIIEVRSSSFTGYLFYKLPRPSLHIPCI